ncbi:MAG: 50S ribosomal protein L3 [Spirochaetota bacterium]
MSLYMLGNKVGMTQIFDENGRVIPVTVIKLAPCIVVKKRTVEKDGYNAIVLGFDDARETRLRKSELGLFRKLGISPKKFLKESRVSEQELNGFEVGQNLSVDIFKKGDYLDITGKSKGRGFTGVMKRHGMAGAKGSHGTHEYFRHGGSIGSNTFPGRVFKGKRMAGRYGGTNVTIQNLLVADVRPENNVILVKGAVPGPNKGHVYIAHAKKKLHATAV